MIFNRNRGFCWRSNFLWPLGSDSSTAWRWVSKQAGSFLHGWKENTLCEEPRGYLEYFWKAGDQLIRKWRPIIIYFWRNFERLSILSAKAINVLSIFFILISTISFCLETIPHFQENNCYTGKNNNSLQYKDYNPARFF